MADPAWIPALVLLEDSGHDWGVYLGIVYHCFRRDFIDSTLTYQGIRLGLKRLPLRDGKEATFWHLISEGDDHNTRPPEERRCERIRWPRPVIERCPCGELRSWRNKRNGEERIVIAFDDFSYVVVLAVRTGYLLPWTAYPVEREHRRRALRKEHEDYQKKLKPPLA